MDNLKEYYGKVDEALACWTKRAQERGENIACINCRKPACCKQRVLAYDKEVMNIAEAVTELEPSTRRRVINQVQKWFLDFSRLSKEEQLDPETPWNKDMYCPLLVDGKCSVYEDRPLACRGHYALEENEDKCNDPDVQSVKMFDTSALHTVPLKSGSVPLYMPIAIAAVLLPKKHAKKARKKTAWLFEQWHGNMSDLARQMKLEEEGGEE